MRMSKLPVPVLAVLCAPVIAVIIVGATSLGFTVEYTFLFIGITIGIVDELGDRIL